MRRDARLMRRGPASGPIVSVSSEAQVGERKAARARTRWIDTLERAGGEAPLDLADHFFTHMCMCTTGIIERQHLRSRIQRSSHAILDSSIRSSE